MAIADNPERPEDDVEMGFFQHLAELRYRLVRAVWGLVPGVAIGAIFHEELLGWLLHPFNVAWESLHRQGVPLPYPRPKVIMLTPQEGFVVYVKIAFVLALLIGGPWIFYQLWQFIAPGLYRREKRMAIPFAASTSVFFICGVAFGYFVVFPLIFEYFLGFQQQLPGGVDLAAEYSLNDLVSLELKLLLGFGIVFLLPVFVWFLAAAGIVDWKQLLKFSRWWLLIAAVLSALLTPPDPVSQLMMLGPLIILYFVSILFAMMFGQKKPKAPA
ncbi:MAG: twin-arginine translocase subunit TatC [Myxococcota bacterium]